jgi:UPF0176 protein
MDINNFKVLLFYHYKKLDNVERIYDLHIDFLKNKDINGRIVIAKEGINGTISGNFGNCEKYKMFLEDILHNPKLDYKDDICKGHLFQKLSIKIKNEIIRMGVECDTTIQTGIHLTPEQWLKYMKEEDTIILDMRSNYEHKLGKFKNAVTFDINSMYEFPDIFKTHKLFKTVDIKDKNIITYCTGGIKCEKASTFFLNQGFKNVYQLEGGIIRYSKEMGGNDFEGKCYVFDDRIGIDVNTLNPSIISYCYVCGILSDIMVNCINNLCNRHTTICESCYSKFDSCCSLECSKSNKKRTNITDYFNKKQIIKSLNQ